MNLLKPNPCVRNLIVGLGLIIFQSCAPVSVKGPPSVLDQEKISELVAGLKEQEGRVYSLFSSGSLMVDDKGSETDSNIVIAGIRDPLRIKIEITHPWGRPLLHILIEETQVHILSFTEKRVYHGYLGGSVSSRLFPARLDSGQVWALVRSYPLLKKYHRAVSFKENQITLLNKKAKAMQVIDLYPGTAHPRLVSFPEQGTKTAFSDFENDDGICYARKIILDDPRVETTLTLEQGDMVFNKPIPDAIFTLDTPRGFKVLPLNGPERE